MPERQGCPGADPSKISWDFTPSADVVGSVREVVARVLRDFRLAQLVTTSPDRIDILDPAGLHDQSWNPTTNGVADAGLPT